MVDCHAVDAIAIQSHKTLLLLLLLLLTLLLLPLLMLLLLLLPQVMLLQRSNDELVMNLATADVEVTHARAVADVERKQAEANLAEAAQRDGLIKSLKESLEEQRKQTRVLLSRVRELEEAAADTARRQRQREEQQAKELMAAAGDGDSLAAAHATILRQQKAYNLLNAEYAEHKQEAADKVAALREEGATQAARVSSLEQQLLSAGKREAEQAEEIARLTEGAALARARAAKAEERWEALNAATHERIAEADEAARRKVANQLRDQEEELAALRAAQTELQANNQQLNAQVTELSRQLDAAGDPDLLLHFRKAQQALEAAEQRCAALQGLLDDVGARSGCSLAEYALLSERLEETAAQLDVSLRHRAEAQAEVKVLQRELLLLQQQKGIVDDQLRSLRLAQAGGWQVPEYEADDGDGSDGAALPVTPTGRVLSPEEMMSMYQRRINKQRLSGGMGPSGRPLLVSEPISHLYALAAAVRTKHRRLQDEATAAVAAAVDAAMAYGGGSGEAAAQDKTASVEELKISLFAQATELADLKVQLAAAHEQLAAAQQMMDAQALHVAQLQQQLHARDRQQEEQAQRDAWAAAVIKLATTLSRRLKSVLLVDPGYAAIAARLRAAAPAGARAAGMPGGDGGAPTSTSPPLLDASAYGAYQIPGLFPDYDDDDMSSMLDDWAEDFAGGRATGKGAAAAAATSSARPPSRPASAKPLQSPETGAGGGGRSGSIFATFASSASDGAAAANLDGSPSSDADDGQAAERPSSSVTSEDGRGGDAAEATVAAEQAAVAAGRAGPPPAHASTLPPPERASAADPYALPPGRILARMLAAAVQTQPLSLHQRGASASSTTAAAARPAEAAAAAAAPLLVELDATCGMLAADVVRVTTWCREAIAAVASSRGLNSSMAVCGDRPAAHCT